MFRTGSYLILLILYLLTSGITARYFLGLLQQMEWKPQEYIRILSRENLRWLPLIFCLVPTAAQIMDYGMFANGITAAYLLLMMVYYWPWPGRGAGNWTGQRKRLYALWMSVWLIFLLPFLLIPKARGDLLFAVFCILFLIQPAVPPALMLADRPLAYLLGKHLIRGSAGILSLHRELKIIAVTGSADTAILQEALEMLLQTEYRCERASRVVSTAVDAAKIIREMEDPALEYLIVRIDAGDMEEMKGILSALHPEITILASADYCVLADEQPLKESRGIRFLNADDPVLRQYVGTEEVLTYGMGEGSDCRGTIERVDSDGTVFSVIPSRSRKMELKTMLLGQDNLTSLVGAVGVAYFLGIPEDRIQWQIRLLRPLPRRMEMTAVRNVIRIEDSASEQEIEGEAALETLRRFSGEKVLITRGFLRQGVIQEEANRRFGAAAADVCDHIILVGEEIAYGLKGGVLGAGFIPEHLHEVPTAQEAWLLVDGLTCDGQKIVLIEMNEIPDADDQPEPELLR